MIRFIEDPAVIIKYPQQDNQILIAIVRHKDLDIWNRCESILPSNTFGIMVIDDLIVSQLGGVPSWKFAANRITTSTLQESIKHIPMVYSHTSENEGVVWARRMAFLVGITHFVSFSTNVSDTTDDIVSQTVVDLNENNPDDMNNAIPEVVWVSNVLKGKNYDDRRLVLQHTTKMIHTPPEKRNIDRMILFGSPEFVNADRFRYTEDKEKCVPVVFRPTKDEKVGMSTIGEMLEYAYSTTLPGAIIFCMRQEATEMPYTVLRSAIRISPKTIASLLPFVMPDVPDPKPELFHRGDYRVTAGYLIRRNMDDTYIISERLKECTLYTNNHPSVVPCEFLKNHYMIGNGTRQVAIGFPSITSVILLNGIKPTPSDVICAEIVPIGLPSSDSVHSIPNIVSKSEYQPPIIIEPLKALSDNQPLEIRTYLNMTNKTVKRSGKEDVEMKDTTTSIAVKYPIQFIDGNNYRLKRDYWSHSNVSQTYWGAGTNQRDTGFIHMSIALENTVWIPSLNPLSDVQSRECVLSLVNQLATSRYIIDYSVRNHITLETNPVLIPIYQRYMEPILGEKKGAVPVQVIDSTTRNVFGGRGTYVASYPVEMKSYGFVPHLIRMANRSIMKSVEIEDESKSGIILGEKWSGLIQSIVEKHCPKITWKCIKTLSEGTPEDFMRATYVIASQTSNAWAGLLFANTKRCKVIEIDYEHDASLSMYHLGMALGVSEYQILPLKNEPVSRCEKRIRDNLLKYVTE
jgi:hypothetical protein